MSDRPNNNKTTTSTSHSSISYSASQSGNYDDFVGSPSSPPANETEEISVQDYLEKYIDGYLIGDLETLIREVKPSEKYNCSFVITLSICAGIEFLGLLLNPKDKIDNKEKDDINRSCFSYYWQHHLDIKYKTAINGGEAYNLIRNGLAHCFMIKHGIGTARSRATDNLRIKIYGGRRVLVIDSDEFFRDFRRSYERAKKILLDGGEGEKLATRRLSNQIATFINDSDNFIKLLSQDSMPTSSSDTTTISSGGPYSDR